MDRVNCQSLQAAPRRSAASTVLIWVLICFGLGGAPAFCAAQADSASSKSNAQRLYEQGLAENQKGLLVAASVSLTDAIALDPTLTDAYYQRGLSFAGMDRPEASQRDFRAAVERGSTRLDPYLRLFAYYRAQGLPKQGAEIADFLIANLPDNAVAGYWERGQFLEAAGQVDEAIAAFEHALHLEEPADSDFSKQLEARIERLRARR